MRRRMTRRRRRGRGEIKRRRKREMEVGGYDGTRAGEERRRREEEEDDGVLSRRDLAEEVQTGLHLHNRYIPAAWTGMEAESSVSSVRYIARLVLARSRDLSRNRREREREREQGEGRRYALAGRGRRGEGGGDCAFDRGAHNWRSARGVREKLARREKSVGASTRRPMTSSELSTSLESFSCWESYSLSLLLSSSSSPLPPFHSISLSHFASLIFFSKLLSANSRPCQENRMLD